MTAQKSARRTSSAWLATITAALLAVSGAAIAPTAALADEPSTIRTATDGSASWGLSTYLNSANPGRPNPSPANYTAPAAFDATSRISTWAAGSGTLTPDGNAKLSFEGKSVNHATTGGGWLTFEDLEVELDANGNGVVSASVAYGTSVPPSVFDPAQAPTRGPARVDVVQLQGNEVAPVLAEGSASWTGLAGLWHEDFLAFLAGDSSADPAVAAWTYATTVTNTGADDRKPSPFSFELDTTSPQLTASVVDATSDGLSVKADLADVISDTGAYVSVIEAGTVDELSLTNHGLQVDYITPNRFTDRAATSTLVVAKAKLDRTKQYEVVSWKAHALPSANTLYGVRTLDVSEAQWDAVFAEPVAAATTTAVKLSKSSAKYNAANSATVTVAATGSAEQPTGAVRLRVAGQSYQANLSNGKATIRLNAAVRAGSHKATVAYTSNAARFANSSGSATLRVTKATPKVSAKLVKSKVKTKQNARVRVTATIPGSLKAKAAKYTVQVFDGKKRIKTQKLSSAGKATVKLPKLKRGTHKIKVKLVSTANTVAKTSATRTLRVVR
ncbi:Ig-like domain repeat protein [Leucobacter weissii]|uniref:Ig-like domain repeat protein n=1 Tax=Leucobacter weissii TaxID=1983706 RepID=A0A939ML46_9MICO|nr:Ig-like domain repeat protein [Leucobacter weissii]MBO1900637.1 Ig-like domain repeat protein [Leucobacter weissii]